MPISALTAVGYSFIIASLFSIDYFLGNGFVDMFQTVVCKIVCTVKRTVREEAKRAHLKPPEAPVSVPVLLSELVVLFVISMCLNKYKKYRSKDRIDELLNESKEALKHTNNFLEKWRLRRLNCKKPSEYWNLNNEQRPMHPHELEVPILHMAIVDSFGTTRSPDRGDAGDTCSIKDSMLLSITSLFDDELDSVIGGQSEELNEDNNRMEEISDLNNRYLWDDKEEDLQ